MTYCTAEEINALFGDISDDISDDMFEVVIKNCTAWIESNLKRHYVPIPTDNPQALNTVAIYYGASDILLSLYHGEELPREYDIWWQKAQDLLEDYIDDQLNNTDDTDVKNSVKNVAWSKSRPYQRNKYGRDRRRC